MQIFCVELPFHNIRGTKIYQEDECNTSMFNMKQSLQHSLQPVSSQQLLDWVLSCLSLGLERNSTAVLKARSKQGRPATHGSVACFKYRWGVEVGQCRPPARKCAEGDGEKQKKTNKILQEGSSSCCFLGQQAYEGLLTPGLHLCSLPNWWWWWWGAERRSGVLPPCTPPHTSRRFWSNQCSATMDGNYMATRWS